jgi:hypothetical protein
VNQQQKSNPSKMAAVQDNRRISSRGSKKSIAPITATSRLRNDYVRYIIFLNLNKDNFFSESNHAFVISLNISTFYFPELFVFGDGIFHRY